MTDKNKKKLVGLYQNKLTFVLSIKMSKVFNRYHYTVERMRESYTSTRVVCFEFSKSIH